MQHELHGDKVEGKKSSERALVKIQVKCHKDESWKWLGSERRELVCRLLRTPFHKTADRLSSKSGEMKEMSSAGQPMMPFCRMRQFRKRRLRGRKH